MIAKRQFGGAPASTTGHPAARGEQVPSRRGSLQDMHGSVQAVWQHTPFEQKAEAHCSLRVQRTLLLT
jgi:hypothetical protein